MVTIIEPTTPPIAASTNPSAIIAAAVVGGMCGLLLLANVLFNLYYKRRHDIKGKEKKVYTDNYDDDENDGDDDEDDDDYIDVDDDVESQQADLRSLSGKLALKQSTKTSHSVSQKSVLSISGKSNDSHRIYATNDNMSTTEDLPIPTIVKTGLSVSTKSTLSISCKSSDGRRIHPTNESLVLSACELSGLNESPSNSSDIHNSDNTNSNSKHAEVAMDAERLRGELKAERVSRDLAQEETSVEEVVTTAAADDDDDDDVLASKLMEVTQARDRELTQEETSVDVAVTAATVDAAITAVADDDVVLASTLMEVTQARDRELTQEETSVDAATTVNNDDVLASQLMEVTQPRDLVEEVQKEAEEQVQREQQARRQTVRIEEEKRSAREHAVADQLVLDAHATTASVTTEEGHVDAGGAVEEVTPIMVETVLDQVARSLPEELIAVDITFTADDDEALERQMMEEKQARALAEQEEKEARERAEQAREQAEQEQQVLIDEERRRLEEEQRLAEEEYRRDMENKRIALEAAQQAEQVAAVVEKERRRLIEDQARRDTELADQMIQAALLEAERVRIETAQCMAQEAEANALAEAIALDSERSRVQEESIQVVARSLTDEQSEPIYNELLIEAELLQEQIARQEVEVQAAIDVGAISDPVVKTLHQEVGEEEQQRREQEQHPLIEAMRLSDEEVDRSAGERLKQETREMREPTVREEQLFRQDEEESHACIDNELDQAAEELLAEERYLDSENKRILLDEATQRGRQEATQKADQLTIEAKYYNTHHLTRLRYAEERAAYEAACTEQLLQSTLVEVGQEVVRSERRMAKEVEELEEIERRKAERLRWEQDILSASILKRNAYEERQRSRELAQYEFDAQEIALDVIEQQAKAIEVAEAEAAWILATTQSALFLSVNSPSTNKTSPIKSTKNSTTKPRDLSPMARTAATNLRKESSQSPSSRHASPKKSHLSPNKFLQKNS